MTRLLEVVVALLIVFVLAIVFGLCLPSHGQIQRTLEIVHPVRQVSDVLSGFRTYPSWTSLTSYDPRVQLTLEGEAGPGSKVHWTSPVNNVGNGTLTIKSIEQDKKFVIDIENNWPGTNKHYTIDLKPSTNGKTLRITWIYDVDYGMDLMARYSGLYLEGDPASQIQIQMNKLSNMLATFPTVDYKEQTFEIFEALGKPVLLVSTTAKRTLDDVAEAASKALVEIEAVIKKNKLTVNGPRTTITTNWGDESYLFDLALPVDRNDVPLPGNVKAATTYTGKTLKTTFTGSPANLPLARLMLKAYALTHGYTFDESTEGPGRFYDELTSDPKAAEDDQAYSVYLPIQLL
jgi:Polyketide cyclase / dehydrase and lipid transport